MAAVKKEKLLNSFFNLPCFCVIRHRRREIIVVTIKVLSYLLRLDLHYKVQLTQFRFSFPLKWQRSELLHEFEIMKKSQFVMSVSGLLHRWNMNRVSASASVL